MSSGRGVVAGAALIDVGAGLDQRLGGGHRALARGEVQRGETALLADQLVVVERTRDAAARPAAAAARGACGRGTPFWSASLVLRQRREVLDASRSACEIGAARDQQLDDVDAIGGGGKHQRRLAVRRFLGVHIGAVSTRMRTASVLPECAASISARGAGRGGGVDRRAARRRAAQSRRRVRPARRDGAACSRRAASWRRRWRRHRAASTPARRRR